MERDTGDLLWQLESVNAELVQEAIVIARHNQITERLHVLVTDRDEITQALKGARGGPDDEELLPINTHLSLLLDELQILNVDLAIEAAASVRIGRITDRMRQLATERDRVSHEIELADQARAGGHI